MNRISALVKETPERLPPLPPPRTQQVPEPGSGPPPDTESASTLILDTVASSTPVRKAGDILL